MFGQFIQDTIHSRPTNLQNLPCDPSHPCIHWGLTLCWELDDTQQVETELSPLTLSPPFTTGLISLPFMTVAETNVRASLSSYSSRAAGMAGPYKSQAVQGCDSRVVITLRTCLCHYSCPFQLEGLSVNLGVFSWDILSPRR